MEKKKKKDEQKLVKKNYNNCIEQNLIKSASKDTVH